MVFLGKLNLRVYVIIHRFPFSLRWLDVTADLIPEQRQTDVVCATVTVPAALEVVTKATNPDPDPDPDQSQQGRQQLLAAS